MGMCCVCSGVAAVFALAFALTTKEPATSMCHRIFASLGSLGGPICMQNMYRCGASDDHFEDGSCASAAYPYCFKHPSGELWVKGEGRSCAKGREVLKKRGNANDGCGGKSKPLPCDTLSVPQCHRISDSSNFCIQNENYSSCAAFGVHFNGSCASAAYPYCLETRAGVEVWAKGEGMTCANGLEVLKDTGKANDGCGGNSKPLLCSTPNVSRCHQISDSDGNLTCREGEGLRCSLLAKFFKDGSCASAAYAYCFTDEHQERWAKGKGKSCAKGLDALKKARSPNDGCSEKSKPLPCGGESKPVVFV